jgi:hypothetical protein
MERTLRCLNTGVKYLEFLSYVPFPGDPQAGVRPPPYRGARRSLSGQAVEVCSPFGRERGLAMALEDPGIGEERLEHGGTSFREESTTTETPSYVARIAS